MEIRECAVSDAAKLAQMNKRLIEDEKSANPMTIDELEARMTDFLSGSYTAYFFAEDQAVVGYALVDNSRNPLYLRQFYIEREYRRRHFGQTAFRLLLAHLGTDTIDVDVLPWNAPGLAFWRSLGFRDTCISMRLGE